MELGRPPRGKAFATVTEKMPASCVPSARLPLGLGGREGQPISRAASSCVATALAFCHRRRKKNYNSQQSRVENAQAEAAPIACHLLAGQENDPPPRALQRQLRVHTRGTAVPGVLRGNALEELHFPEGFPGGTLGLGTPRRLPRLDLRLAMAFLAGFFGSSAGRSVALLSGRWLQPRVWMGRPDAWGLPAPQQTRGRTRGNEYQPSNIKRKRKHGWIRRLSTPAGVQVLLRRMLKGRKSLSH